MDLHPCACGEFRFDRNSTLVEHGRGVISVYEGACENCGAVRRFEIRLPDEQPPAGGGGVIYGGDEPSTIIDPGQFLQVADDHAAQAPRSLDGLDERQQRWARRDVQVALACVAEVVKFIPAGEDRVPETAFTSAEGRAVYEREPERLSRARLDSARDAYLELLASYGA